MSQMMNVADFPQKSRHSLYDLLLAFENSSYDVVEVVYPCGTYKDLRSIVYSLRKSVRRHRWPYKVVTQQGRIYLCK